MHLQRLSSSKSSWKIYRIFQYVVHITSIWSGGKHDRHCDRTSVAGCSPTFRVRDLQSWDDVGLDVVGNLNCLPRGNPTTGKDPPQS